jgi:exodeoxyribonuclease-3
MARIATWNVNSVKARAEHLVRWLGESKPDIALLQELKTPGDAFPHEQVEELGYHVAIKGQKSYNGVAILSKSPIEVELDELPGDKQDDQARYLEAFTGGLRVASIYLPNGNPAPGDKYDYKLNWMARLYDHVVELLKTEDAVVLGGDYNVIPTSGDVYEPSDWTDDALFRHETRAAWRKIVYLGMTDAFKAFHSEDGRYTFWDYQRGAWNRDHGLRIDHLLLSPQAADRLTDADIDRKPRGWEKPSDHTPVWCELGD